MDEQLDASQLLPKDKAELLERIEAARRALGGTIGRLNEAQLVAAGPDGGWSVKDHLAHLAAWEAGIAALLRKEPRYPAMGFDEPLPSGSDTGFVDVSYSLNEIIYERNKGRSLEDVREYLRDAQRSLSDVLDALRDDDLRKTYSHFQPDEPGQDSGAPIVGWVAGNTHEHYAEHQEWIEALIGSG